MNFAKFVGVAVLVLASVSGWAETTTRTCSGSVYSMPQSVSGFCTYSSCTGTIFGETLTINTGSCDAGITFEASASSSFGTLNGSCLSGFFNAYAFPQYLNFTGKCSDGGTFNGSAYVSGGSYSGNCTDNGSFFATSFPGSISVTGTCVNNSGVTGPTGSNE